MNYNMTYEPTYKISSIYYLLLEISQWKLGSAHV